MRVKKMQVKSEYLSDLTLCVLGVFVVASGHTLLKICVLLWIMIKEKKKKENEDGRIQVMSKGC